MRAARGAAVRRWAAARGGLPSRGVSRPWGVPSVGSRPHRHCPIPRVPPLCRRSHPVPLGPIPSVPSPSAPRWSHSHSLGPLLWVSSRGTLPPPFGSRSLGPAPLPWIPSPPPSGPTSRPHPRIPSPPPPRCTPPRVPTRCPFAPRRAAGRVRVRPLSVPPRVRRPRLRVSPGAGRLRAGRHRMQRERTVRVRALPLPRRVRGRAVRALPPLRRALREAAVSGAGGWGAGWGCYGVRGRAGKRGCGVGVTGGRGGGGGSADGVGWRRCGGAGRCPHGGPSVAGTARTALPSGGGRCGGTAATRVMGRPCGCCPPPRPPEPRCAGSGRPTAASSCSWWRVGAGMRTRKGATSPSPCGLRRVSVCGGHGEPAPRRDPKPQRPRTWDPQQ